MDTTIGSLHLQESWKFYVGSLGAMLALAGLDFVGAMFAKEWAERGRLPMFLLGWISFSVLFFVYARILKVAELSTVTIGWIVFLQVGLLVLDATHYDVRMPWPKWAAIVVILVLQVYLIAAPNITKPEQLHLSHPGESISIGVTGENDVSEMESSVPPTVPAPGTDVRRPSRPLGPNAA